MKGWSQKYCRSLQGARTGKLRDDRDVRATLYAAANAMMMRSVASTEIKSWGLGLMKRTGRRRAVVVVARKRAVIMQRMWVDDTEFCHKSLEATMT